MEKLVDIVHFLHLEIHEAFGAAGNKVNNIDDYYFDYLWCEDYKYIKVIFSDCRETSASQPSGTYMKIQLEHFQLDALQSTKLQKASAVAELC
ncbi:hypothetical protein V6Z12_D09G035000 [Gossypium hirsutum]